MDPGYLTLDVNFARELSYVLQFWLTSLKGISSQYSYSVTGFLYYRRIRARASCTRVDSANVPITYGQHTTYVVLLMSVRDARIKRGSSSVTGDIHSDT